MYKFLLIGLLLIARCASAQDQRVIILPANSYDNPVETISQQDLINYFIPGGIIQQYFQQISYGHVNNWDVLVRPWVTRPSFFPRQVNYSNCDDYPILQNYALGEAINAGVDWTSYPRRVYLVPDFNCGMLGLSTVATQQSVTTLLGTVHASVMAHEFLHTFGLLHALGEECSTDGCAIVENDDPYSIMGNQFTFSHPGLADKIALGWVDVPGSPRSQVITTTGSYSLEPYETPLTADGIVGLVIKALPYWLIIEARPSGVILRTAYESDGVLDPSKNVLLDMDLLTRFSRPVLNVGESYTRFNVTITNQAFSSSNGAMILVNFNDCNCGPGAATNLRAI